MPFKTLTQIISVGQKVNSIFIKLKLKFKGGKYFKLIES